MTEKELSIADRIKQLKEIQETMLFKNILDYQWSLSPKDHRRLFLHYYGEVKVLDKKKYKGYGRPRKTDYSPIEDIQDQYFKLSE